MIALAIVITAALYAVFCNGSGGGSSLPAGGGFGGRGRRCRRGSRNRSGNRSNRSSRRRSRRAVVTGLLGGEEVVPGRGERTAFSQDGQEGGPAAGLQQGVAV